MDNSISYRQNLPDNIQNLAAQRYFYSRAKKLASVQALLDILTPIVGAIAVLLKPEADIWAAFVGIIVALLDTVWLESRQSGLRGLGANVQEEFDCNVLQLPWNNPLAGQRVSPEDIHEAYRGYKPSKSAPLEDWYPKAVIRCRCTKRAWYVSGRILGGTQSFGGDTVAGSGVHYQP